MAGNANRFRADWFSVVSFSVRSLILDCNSGVDSYPSKRCGSMVTSEDRRFF
jgi:hypothetical protein